jgi:hypothetical protein
MTGLPATTPAGERVVHGARGPRARGPDDVGAGRRVRYQRRRDYLVQPLLAVADHQPERLAGLRQPRVVESFRRHLECFAWRI